MGTTLLRDARIIDGSGEPSLDGHVLIEGDRIAGVLKAGAEEPEAERVVELEGKALAPGFIDMHSHLDWLLPQAGHRALVGRLLEQGVTTVVAGNCGLSPAPFKPEAQKAMESLASIAIDEPIDYRWRTMAEFLDHLEKAAPLLNVAQLLGHASVRHVMGRTRRGTMPEKELDACLDETRRSFDAGACGLSFGLGYEAPLDAVLAHELCLYETDAIIRSSGHPNPAALGTFPRILGRYSRERGLVGLEEAVRRMTRTSAERYGLDGRGSITSGNYADLVVFDPEVIIDTPPQGSQTAGRPRGIDKVFLNGQLVVDNGLYVEGAQAGQVIRTCG